jgi:shikimate dehydrogenase
VAHIRLGLIGDNIATSRAPELHQVCGRLSGLAVTYDLLVPRDLNLDFDRAFDRAQKEGYRGLNITYPYKETVVGQLAVDDASIKAISACNTVVFERPRPRGANTNYTGFIVAYRRSFGTASPGVVAMAGSGGVGKAVAFALAQLGAKALHLFDIERAKSERLKQALAGIFPAIAVRTRHRSRRPATALTVSSIVRHSAWNALVAPHSRPACSPESVGPSTLSTRPLKRNLFETRAVLVSRS